MTNNFPLRKKIILGTTLAISSVFSYARRSYGACVNSVSTTYVCTSDNPLTQLSVNANNANVVISDVGDFVIDLADNNNANGFRVAGEGAISFRSGDNTSISANANALRIDSSVDEGDGANGSINITADGSQFFSQNYTAIYASVNDGLASSAINITSSTVSGFDNGLFFSQSGVEGNLDINIVDSDISAANPSDGHGIKIYSANSDGNITLTSDVDSHITGGANAISIQRNISSDEGNLDVTINGNLTATNGRGFYLTNTSVGDVDILTAESSYIRSNGQGIRLMSSGEGETNLTLNGDIKSDNEVGVLIRTQYDGTALNVTINEESSIQASNSNFNNSSNAMEIYNHVSGDAIINISGDLTTDHGRAFYMKSVNSAADISLTFAESSTLSTRSNNNAIRLANYGTGFTNVAINGVASSAAYDTAVLIVDGYNAGALTFTTGEHSVISAGAHPSVTAYDGVKIYTANNYSSDITINGDVSSANRHGFYLYGQRDSSGDISFVSGAQSKISGVEDALKLNNLGSGETSVEVGGEVESTNGVGVNIIVNDADNNQALTFTTSTNSSIISKEAGVAILNRGTDVTQVDIRGNIIAQGEAAIYVDSSAGTDMTVQDGAQLEGNRAISNNQNRLNLTLEGSTGAVSLKGNSGVAVNFSAQNDRLTIKGLVSLDGSVSGGNGNDLLEFENANLTLADDSEISGFETVDFTGSNIINGDFDFSQAQLSIAQNANFKLNGNATFDELTMQSGSILSGNNTLEGDVVIASGATVAPGNSVGTINIVGNFTFNNGAIFDVEFDNSGADKIVASGNVTINNGAIANITKINGSNPHSASYKIIEAAQITGKFTPQNNGNNVSLLYSQDSRSLNLINFNTNVLKSQNQSLAASAILFNDTISDQIAENAFVKNKNFWMRNIYRNRDIASDEGISARDNSYGIAFGGEVETANPAYKIGFSLSQISNNLNLENSQGSKKSDAFFAAIYATYNSKINGNDFFTSLSLASGTHDSNNSRQVTNNNVSSYSNSEKEDRDSSATIQAGLKFLSKNNWQISPRISATYIKTKASGFSEAGGGLAAVNIDDYSFETLKFRESLRFSKHDFKGFRGVGLVPYFEVGLAQERSVGKQEISGSFISGDRFSTNINQQNRNFVNASIGLQMAISKDVSAFLNQEISRSKDEKRYDGRVGLNVKF